MKKLLITILITLICIPMLAQSAASIRKNNSYIYTEATAALQQRLTVLRLTRWSETRTDSGSAIFIGNQEKLD